MNWVLNILREAKNNVNVFIFDACRNNPFTQGPRAGFRGLAATHPFTGELIAFSAYPNTVAEDGKGRNSPYATAILQYIKEPGLLIEDVFTRVRIAVRQETNEKQVPWESTSLLGDFYFAGR